MINDSFLIYFNKTHKLLVYSLSQIPPLLVLFYVLRNNKAEQHGVKDMTKPKAINQEDEVVNLILNLPEVKRKSAQVEKDSQGKRHLETYVETPPTAQDPNY